MALPPGYVSPKPPSPPAGSKSGHYADVDWEALLNADPEYHQALIDEQAGLATAGTARRIGIINALVAYGLVPSEADYAKMTPEEAAAVRASVTPTVEAAIAGNTQSVAAQARDAQQRGGVSLRARLAARGMLYSGALTGGSTNLTNAYNTNLYGGGQKLLENLGLGETAYGNEASRLSTGTRTALGNASGRIALSDPWRWIEDPEAVNTNPWVPGPTPNPHATPGAYGGAIADSGEEAWPVNWGAGPALVAPPQHNVPRVHPATAAVIARSRAMAKVPRRVLRQYR